MHRVVDNSRYGKYDKENHDRAIYNLIELILLIRASKIQMLDQDMELTQDFMLTALKPSIKVFENPLKSLIDGFKYLD